MSNDAELITNFDLDDFSWDTTGIIPEAVTEVTTEEDTEEEQEEEPQKKVEVVIKPDGTKEDSEEEEDDEDDPEEKGKEAKKANPSAGDSDGKDTLRLLKEKGIFDFDESELEDEDFDEQEFIEEKLEESVNSKLEEMLSGLPTGLKDMIKFASNGGDFMDVVKDLNSPSELADDLDMSNKSDQEKALRYLLKSQGHDQEYIDSNIEFLEFKNKLKETAEREYDKYLVEEETKEDRRILEHKETLRKQREKMTKDKNDISTFLSEKPKVLGGIKFTRKEIKSLPSYMVDPSITLEDGRVTSGFNKDLVEALQDKEKALVLAKLTKNNFNMQEFFKDIETSMVDKLEGNLQRRNDGKGSSVITGVSGSSQKSNQKTHLVDFL